MPKLYPCPLSSEPCQYGGNKRFNWGFAWGTRPYCHKAHKFIYVLKGVTELSAALIAIIKEETSGVIVCPLGKAKEAR